MSNTSADDPEAKPYVRIKNKYGQEAIGTDHKEALWRAKRLGYDCSPEAKPDRCNVSVREYRNWWNQRSDKERSDLLQGHGSQPPPE